MMMIAISLRYCLGNDNSLVRVKASDNDHDFCRHEQCDADAIMIDLFVMMMLWYDFDKINKKYTN